VALHEPAHGAAAVLPGVGASVAALEAQLLALRLENQRLDTLVTGKDVELVHLQALLSAAQTERDALSTQLAQAATPAEKARLTADNATLTQRVTSLQTQLKSGRPLQQSTLTGGILPASSRARRRCRVTWAGLPARRAVALSFASSAIAPPMDPDGTRLRRP